MAHMNLFSTYLHTMQMKYDDIDQTIIYLFALNFRRNTLILVYTEMYNTKCIRRKIEISSYS